MKRYMFAAPFVVALMCLVVVLLLVFLVAGVYEYNLSAFLFLGDKRFSAEAENPIPTEQLPLGLVYHLGVEGYHAIDYYLVAQDPLLLNPGLLGEYKKRNQVFYARVFYPLLARFISETVEFSSSRLGSVGALSSAELVAAEGAAEEAIAPVQTGEKAAFAPEAKEAPPKPGLSFAQPDRLSLVMMAINLVSILVGAYFLARFLRKRASNPALALVFWLSGGVLFGLFLDTPIPLAAMFLVIGMCCHEGEKYALAFPFFALSMLTHESMALAVGALALGCLLSARGRPFLVYLISAAPAVLYRLYVVSALKERISLQAILGVLNVARPDRSIWPKILSIISEVNTQSLGPFNASAFLLFFGFLVLAFLWSVMRVAQRGGIYPFMLLAITAFVMCASPNWWKSYIFAVETSAVVFLPLVLSFKEEEGAMGRILAALTLLGSLVVLGRVMMLAGAGWKLLAGAVV